MESLQIEQRILENLSSAILLFDANWKLRHINPAGEMLLAISSRQVLGEHVRELINCRGKLTEEKLLSAINLGQPFTEREILLLISDGQEKTVNCTIIPITSNQGGTEVMVELQQIDRQLRISREEQLISQQHASQVLVRGLAHEIKNPLGGLRGAAQLLERELEDESLHEYTQIVITEADRLQLLVDRMLGPNKLPNKKEINIHRVLERVCGLVEAESAGELELVRDYDPSIPAIYGDSDQLIQALLNLVQNAARAGNHVIVRTRVGRQITIGNARHRLVLIIDIEDNGTGIPKEIEASIFFPMVSGQEGGTGLGLPIAQALISQHQGLIECETKPGKTVFSVLLPLESK